MSNIPIYDLGDTILVETTVKDIFPHNDTEEIKDPDTIKIECIDPDGNEHLSESDMIQKETGKYYEKIHTEETDTAGTYKIIIRATKKEIKEKDVRRVVFE